MKLWSLIAPLFIVGASQAALAATYTTTKCKQFGHPEFQIDISSKAIPETDIVLFLSWLEERVASKERFKAGETIQIGWMITKLQASPSGTLIVTEPDMKSVPIKFINSLDNTLKHLRSQKDSLESVGKSFELTFPSLRQSVVVHKNYKATNNVLLDRATPVGDDSGWWVSDLNDKGGNQDPKNFVKISLFQLALDRPDLVKFFAFPPGLQVVIDSRIGIAVLKDRSEIPFVEGSFLSQLNKKSR